MANKIRAIIERFGVPCTIHTANLAKGVWLKITGDATVDAVSAEDDFAAGFVRVTSKTADGPGTMESRFSAIVDAQCSGAIAAGDKVKTGTTATGVQTFKKWTAGTDNPVLLLGVCWIGGGNGDTGTFLIF